ncbi:MAG: TraR/DksA C4-type zinc finger protein [Acidimicrobiales bacterium]
MTAAKRPGAKVGSKSARPAKKATPKKAPARATPTKAVKKSSPPPKKAAVTAKKAPAKKPPPKKAAVTAKKAPAKKPPPKKAAPLAKKAPAKKAPPTKAVAEKAAPVRAGSGAAASAPPAPAKPEVGPYAGDAKFLAEQRELLLGERSIYAGQAVSLRAEADSLALEREPGDVQFDEESGEGGTVTVDRERNLALSVQAALAVEEIDDALRKIERTTYGSCERCHQPIPKARLRALPFARLCVACKSGGLSRR